MNRIIKKTPLPIAGLMLALASLGNLLSSYNILYKNILGTISVAILLLLLIKILKMPKEIIKDLENPVIASVTPTFFMGLMVLSTYIKPFSEKIGFVIWLTAIMLHSVYIIYFTKKYILTFSIKKVFASYFVVYVGIVAGALTSSSFKMESLGQGLFWFGFAAYLILLPVIIYRLIKHRDIPEPAVPTLTIMAAPANLCLAGYFNSFQEKNISIILFLAFISIIMFVFVLLNLPKMLKLKFYPSYSSFTFPFVITAVAMKMTNAYLMKMGKGMMFLSNYSKFLEIFAVIMVLYVLIRYTQFLLEDSINKKIEKSA
ncbi:potassium-tellurite ethidium and proflavin transporter [Caloramator mitchellensis]|uniref:Potassium-tellurite ethidium and proflavin transporter n=1 Tax=Caloramator mitchellensis TaxID=908809 RepID=A0A0R3JU20_CALMK|nr:TDT family transporter [Caloramator mitchellensis]KRQ86522.1 potassium-tellurite ethidium and proflavin transporter [Caloramator mitchellensis]